MENQNNFDQLPADNTTSKPVAILKFSIKILLVIALLWWVYSKVDIDKALTLISQANIFYIIIAFITFFTAQIASAYRTRYYFRKVGQDWPHSFTIAFYLVGMFLNTLLPSSIGGDGYKIYFLKKYGHLRARTSLRLILSERASGLFLLLLLSLGISLLSQLPQLIEHFFIGIGALTFILICGYFISIRIILKETPSSAFKAMPYSFIVQLFNFITFTCILLALNHSLPSLTTTADYNLLFLTSSVASIIPISVGGAGIREITFLYGANVMHLDVELGVASAFLFFVVTVICTSTGAPFLHRLSTIYHQSYLQRYPQKKSEKT